MALTIVDSERHANLKLKKKSDFEFARQRVVVPIWGRELPQAALDFPIVLTHREGLWIPMALMGLQDGKNQFVSPDGEWLADYVPAVLRAHPFYAVMNEEGGTVLGIDEDDPAVIEGEDPKGESLPLFDSDGSPSSLTQKALQILEQLRAQQEKTWAAFATIEELDLIVPWRSSAVAKGLSAQSLYIVDESKMNALSEEQFLRLKEPGVLTVLYSHLFSLKHLETLNKARRQVWLEASTQGGNALFSSEESLFIFGEE